MGDINEAKAKGLMGVAKAILTSNNIIPIVVAVITAIGSLQYVSYRFDELKEEKAEKGQLKGVMIRLDNYIETQNKINDLMLQMMANRGYISQKSEKDEKKESRGLYTYYGYKASQLMQELKAKERKLVKK